MRILRALLLVFAGLLLGWSIPNPIELWGHLNPVTEFSVCLETVSPGTEILIVRRDSSIGETKFSRRMSETHAHELRTCAIFSDIPGGYYDIYVEDLDRNATILKATLHLWGADIVQYNEKGTYRFESGW